VEELGGVRGANSQVDKIFNKPLCCPPFACQKRPGKKFRSWQLSGHTHPYMFYIHIHLSLWGGHFWWCVPAIPGRNKKFKTLAHIRIWSEDHVLNKYYSSFECSHTVGYTCYPFGQVLMSCLYRFPFNFAGSWWAYFPLFFVWAFAHFLCLMCAY